MKISDIRIRMIRRDGILRAAASFTIDDCFVIHDVRIFEREGERFISMPSRKTAEGEYKDIAHPINSETREYLQREILAAYLKALREED